MSDQTITSLSSGNGESYRIKQGFTDAQINQLIDYSKSDPELKKFTSDPQRFATRDGFDKFSTHILAYFTLVDDSDNLMGLIWFDDFAMPKHVIPTDAKERRDPSTGAWDDNYEDYGISFAIRVYEDVRGKGLAVPFTKKALEDFLKTKDYKQKTNNGIWLAVSPDNYPAISTYEKSGFKKIGMWEEKNKQLMIL